MTNWDIQPNDWIFYGQWEQPFLSNEFWMRVYNRDTFKELNLPAVEGNLLVIDSYFFIHAQDIDTLRNYVCHMINVEDPIFLKNLNIVSQQYFSGYQDVVQKMQEETDPYMILKYFVDYNKDLMPFWYLGCILNDFIVEEKFLKMASEHELDPQKIFHAVPTRETIMLRQLDDLRKLKRLLKERQLYDKIISHPESVQKVLENDVVVWKEIQKCLKEYIWIGTHHLSGEGYSLGTLLDDLRTIKDAIPEKMEEIPKEFDYIVQLSSEIAYIRQYSAEIFNIVAFNMRKTIANLGITLDQFNLIKITELEKGIKDHKLRDTHDLEERQKHYCALLRKGRCEYVFDPVQTKSIFDQVYNLHTDESQEIRGMTAMVGHADGEVKVVISPKDVSKMKMGDILVTTMTTPDFIPLMKKASAIVTDIGGMLSHAAIVSRELNKPCIIGTKNATKILKDGQRVKVDADKGVVEILEDNIDTNKHE